MSVKAPSSASAELPSDPTSSLNKRRSSRACDQCRRTKSKCRKPVDPNKPCSNCIVAGLNCTYQGPSYKRGPPKGYITAIEQRLHQVEALLGAIIHSSDARARAIVADLKTDPIAREILNRVDGGPYGSAAAASSRPADFSTTIRRLKESQESCGTRDSRVKRENVSNRLDEVPAPTTSWLRCLEDILQGNAHAAGPSTNQLSSQSPMDYMSNDYPKSVISSAGPAVRDEPLSAVSTYTGSGSEFGESEGEALERREDEEGIGRLSVDEHNEIRYHSESSGMKLLDKLTNDSSSRNKGGIWELPMARTWPYAEKHLAHLDAEDDAIEISWPDADHQRHLIELYFTYAHPDIPVIHKPSFLALCDQQSSTGNQKRSKLQQKLFQLLLLSIFTVSSRFNEKEMPKPNPGILWEAGCDYLASARILLNSVLHMSSLTACQSLIILAYREFGLGSFEQGSLFIAIAVRMAQDMGLHRTADGWQRFGHDIFNEEQKQERKHVWWTCNIEEKLIACSLGNPITIRESEYDTELPVAQTELGPLPEDIEAWRPHPSVQNPGTVQTLSYTLSVFRSSSLLSEITGRIIENLYSIRQKPWPKKVTLLQEYDKQLDDWSLSLPKQLLINSVEPRGTGPNVLRMHVQHAATVILLHRKFLPKYLDNRETPLVEAHGLDSSLEFRICQEAAIRVTNLVSTIRELYTLKACSAHLPSCLLSAGIMHLASLSMQQGDIQGAYASLVKTLSCLKEMEHTWPSAMRWLELLGSAFSRFEGMMPNETSFTDQHFSNGLSLGHSDRDANSRMMAHLLGLEFPDTGAGSNANGQIMRPEKSYTLAMSESDSMSNSPFTPDAQQWMQNYTDVFIPLNGYDFQSFT